MATTGSSHGDPRAETDVTVSRLVMPAEYAEHSATIMCWPARLDLYGPHFAEAEEAHALIANTIARFEPVVMVVDPGGVDRASSLCGSNVTIHPIKIDDAWARDTGPIYAFDDQGDRVAVDFVFNGWGGKFEPHADDANLASRLAAELDDDIRKVPMVLEGGSITVDGFGKLITTEQCLLNPNRNPGLTREQIAQGLALHLGADDVVWLPHGLALDADTDGHVDNVAAFTRRGHVLLQGCNDPAEDDHERLAINERVLRAHRGNDGDSLEADVVPVLPFLDTDMGRVVVPYMNLYVGNGFVLVPVCGHEADDDMVQMIGEFFPGREPLPLDVGRILAIGGGGIHCITQQIPMIGVGA